MADKPPPVDLDATVVARLRPGLVVLLLVFCVFIMVFVVVGAWGMLFDSASERPAWMALAFGVLLLLTAFLVIQMAMGLGWLLATASQPVLVISSAGLLDRRVSPKVIAWTAVTQVSEARSGQGMPALVGSYVGIDRRVLKELPPPWPRSFFKLRLKPIATISAVATDIDPRTLHATLSAFWKARKDQMEPINV